MPSRSRFAARSSTSLGLGLAAAATAAGLTGWVLDDLVFAASALAAAAALACLLSLSLVVRERHRHVQIEKRLITEATEREAERTRLSEQLITAEQDERRRISLFLHDGPLQSLSGIALMHDAALAALREGRAMDAESVLVSALARERDTIQAIRDLSFSIEPIILRDQGFGPAVQALADQIEKAGNVRLVLDLEEGEHLGEKAQVALYQAIRESLSQALRRHPARISVGIAKDEGGGFTIAIADDGVEERRRSGVEAIIERVRMISGKVSLESNEADGTVVTISVPRYVATSSASPQGTGDAHATASEAPRQSVVPAP